MPRKTNYTKLTDRHKAWNKKKISSKSYRIEEREKAKSFLIICEGENTEPEYFKAFPLGNAVVETYGLGRSKTALVEYVVEITKADPTVQDQEIWVIFDMDISGPQEQMQKEDFNAAIALAEQHKFKVGYSNDCFELWFVLHYQFTEAQWKRFQYYDKLSELWNCNYQKDGKVANFCRNSYRRLAEDERSNQATAIIFAQKLYEKQGELSYSDQNPCTRIHELVRELNKYL